jgi:hypothetical protein
VLRLLYLPFKKQALRVLKPELEDNEINQMKLAEVEARLWSVDCGSLERLRTVVNELADAVHEAKKVKEGRAAAKTGGAVVGGGEQHAEEG